MKNGIISLLSLVLSLGFCAGASFVYEGAFYGASGEPEANCDFTITLRLYEGADKDAKPRWERRNLKVRTDENGLFRILVDDRLGLNDDEPTPTPELAAVLRSAASKTLSVGIKIGSAAEIAPRQTISVAPYAQHAADASAAFGDFGVPGNLRAQSAVVLDQSKSASGQLGRLEVAGTFSAGSLVCESVTSTVTSAFLGGIETKRDVKANGLEATGAVIAGQTATIGRDLVLTTGALSVNDAAVIPRPGMIALWFDYAGTGRPPDGWAFCDGGPGRPDLRGRFLVGAGGSDGNTGKASDGGVPYQVGDTGGEMTVELTVGQLPQHSHGVDLRYFDKTLTSSVKAEAYAPPGSARRDGAGVNPSPSSTYAGGSSSSPYGNAAPHENRPAYTALYYIIKVDAQ